MFTCKMYLSVDYKWYREKLTLIVIQSAESTTVSVQSSVPLVQQLTVPSSQYILVRQINIAALSAIQPLGSCCQICPDNSNCH